MTLLTAGALTDPKLPATASNVCTTDVRLDGVGRMPPQTKNPGYAGEPDYCQHNQYTTHYTMSWTRPDMDQPLHYNE